MQEISTQQNIKLKTTRKKINKTIFQNSLILEGDRLVVGVSGGKDSLVLLHSLAIQKNTLPFDFEISAVHIKVRNLDYEADLDFIKKLCNEFDIKFYDIEIELDFSTQNKLSTCFICSWHRRTALFQFTVRNGFNKLAFGHHMNDMIETLVMNMAYKGEISAMSYKTSMLNNKFEIIRPMLDIDEKFIIEYAEIMNFKSELKKCPFSKDSKRDLVKNIIEKLSEANPNVKKNLFRSVKKVIYKHLPINDLDKRE